MTPIGLANLNKQRHAQHASKFKLTSKQRKAHLLQLVKHMLFFEEDASEEDALECLLSLVSHFRWIQTFAR